jgi:hypothetical protein
MPATITIKTHEMIDKGHVIFYVENNSSSCGSIDFISGKINFNISCNSFVFKGMEYMKDMTLAYKDESLVFTFSNKKSLSVAGSIAIFERMTTHIKIYQQQDDQPIKDSFFTD